MRCTRCGGNLGLEVSECPVCDFPSKTVDDARSLAESYRAQFAMRGNARQSVLVQFFCKSHFFLVCGFAIFFAIIFLSCLLGYLIYLDD